MCYLYGTALHDTTRYSAMHVLYVDYDQGPIGESVIGAYNLLQGHYWGAIYAHANALTQLAAAVTSSGATQAYDRSQALQYYYKSARYSAYATVVYLQLAEIVQTTAAVYAQSQGATLLSIASNLTDPAIATTLLLPVGGTAIDLAPMN